VDYVKTSEAAEHFRVSLDTIYRWIKSGRLVAEDVGSGKRHIWRIPADTGCAAAAQD
jgi:excisionase family DNA binding protein